MESTHNNIVQEVRVIYGYKALFLSPLKNPFMPLGNNKLILGKNEALILMILFYVESETGQDLSSL